MKYEYVETFGSAVQKHSERLVVSEPSGEGGQRTKRQVPALHLDHLLIGSRGVSISSDALELCCDRGIPVTIVDRRGKPVGKFTAPAIHGTSRTRRAQIRAYENGLGVTFARSVVIGKAANQAINLKYFAKNRRERSPDQYETLRKSAEAIDRVARRAKKISANCIDEVRQPLMVLEAEASRIYWSSLSALYGSRSGFVHREQRGTKNPVNAALNYAYGVLTGEVWTACLLAGLEPYAGILHADRPGRLSFVLDLIEEFRPVVADRVVFALAAKGWRIEQEENGWLSLASKNKLLASLAERLDSPEPDRGRRRKLRNVIQRQAYAAAQHFLGNETYVPYKQRW